MGSIYRPRANPTRRSSYKVCFIKRLVIIDSNKTFLRLQYFNKPKQKKEILITIDDAFESFYTEAWPYLKENKIPFILFVSTEPVGKRG